MSQIKKNNFFHKKKVAKSKPTVAYMQINLLCTINRKTVLSSILIVPSVRTKNFLLSTNNAP